MKVHLFAKPIRRDLSPQDAEGAIAAFEAITGKALTQERIADIRANYAAFQARKANEQQTQPDRSGEHITEHMPPPTSTVLQDADTVIAACEAMKALTEEWRLADRASVAAAQVPEAGDPRADLDL
jgi:hypothetical protein